MADEAAAQALPVYAQLPEVVAQRGEEHADFGRGVTVRPQWADRDHADAVVRDHQPAVASAEPDEERIGPPRMPAASIASRSEGSSGV